jgi:hypothetical protein
MPEKRRKAMSSELREALTAAGAQPFVPKIIDPVLVEYQRRFAPWCRSIPTRKWNSTTYYFNQRTVVVGGGAVPDGGARPVSTSTYVQDQFTMAHVQAVGAVTGYAQEVTQEVIQDLRATEINGAIKGYFWDIETFCGWGNAASTLNQAQPQFDGLDTQIQNFSAGGAQNVIDYGGRSLSLSTLDEMIDMVSGNAAEPVADSSWMFVMSTTAEAKIGQLLVAQQRYTDVEIEAGLIVSTYKRVPLVPSSFLSTRGYSVGTVTPSTATTGGSIAASTAYKYMVSAVIARQGEILPSAEVSQTVGSGGNTNTVTLSFTPPSGQDGLGAQLYKVWRTAAAGAAGTETFLGYVDSTVGLMTDGVTPIVTNQIVDTGSALIPQNSSGPTVPGTLPTSYLGTNASMMPPGAGQENIYLMSRDPGNIVRPFVREARMLDVYPTASSPDSLPFAVMGDTCLAVRTPKFCGRSYRVGVSV